MYFCCIRKIFKRFCKCIQYVCLDTFENLAKKKFLIFFWNINSLKNDKKMLFETLTFWKMNFRWSWLSTFPLTSYFYFNVQKAIFKREFKSTSQGSTITFQCPSQNHLSLKRFFVAKLRKKKCWTDHLSHCCERSEQPMNILLNIVEIENMIT